MAVEHGDYAEAQSILNESLQLRREIGDAWGIAAAFNNLARAIEGLGDYVRADELYTESLALLRDLADKGGIANTTANLGLLALARNDIERARQFFKECLIVSQELGYKEGIASALEGFAHLAALEGRALQAARLIGVVDQIYTQSDIQLTPIEQAKHDRIVEAACAGIDDQAYAAAWAEGQALGMDLMISSVLG
jgi:tetratricopeptide (TPR) repeat protein